MKKILCATDFSPRSELAVDRAAALARQFGAELVLLHIVDDEQPRPMVDRRCEEARAALAESLNDMRAKTGIQGSIAIRTGTAFAAIVDATRALNVDLLVMGAHRRGLLHNVIIGTTVERVLRTGSHPVLMVNAATFVNYESVLLALDASDVSARAARAAKALGLIEGTRVSVVHAFEPLYKGMLGWAGVRADTVTEYSENWVQKTTGELQTFLNSIGLSDAAHHLVLEEGPPFVAIKKVVERTRPHLLVVGTRGNTGLRRALLGSVAERIISEIECDVLAVPPTTS